MTVLDDKYGLQALDHDQVLHLMQLLGGQPYLLNRAFYAMVMEKFPWAKLLTTWQQY